MSASDLLDDAKLDRLTDLLEERAVPFKGFNLEALDGYLSALAVSPETVPPEEWQPAVWGGKVPRWSDADEAAEVDMLLMSHWRMVEQRVRHDAALAARGSVRAQRRCPGRRPGLGLRLLPRRRTARSRLGRLAGRTRLDRRDLHLPRPPRQRRSAG